MSGDLKDYIPAFCAITAAIVAIIVVALNQKATTLREYTKRRLDLADDMLAALYEADEAIREIRSRTSVLEGRSRPRGNSETPSETAALDVAFGPREKMAAREKTFTALKEKKFKCMAVFGQDARRPFDLIEDAKRLILISSDILVAHFVPRTLAHPFVPDHSFPTQQAYDDFLNQMRYHQAVIHWTGDPDKITEIVSEALRWCRRD